jgi:hypothetical protein
MSSGWRTLDESLLVTELEKGAAGQAGPHREYPALPGRVVGV